MTFMSPAGLLVYRQEMQNDHRNPKRASKLSIPVVFCPRPSRKTGEVLTVARLDGALGRRPASPRSSVAAGSSGFHGTGIVDWPPKEVSSLHFYVKVIFFYQKLISIKL